MKLSTILDQIDLGSIALPEFQRGFVWNRGQVRSLMNSLYRRHPIGSLLVWVTGSEGAVTRGDHAPAPGVVKLLLDGQQRITSLYGIIRGRSPRFFDGDERAFTGLYFHLEDEVFEFFMTQKMKDNPLWIDVTKLMKDGVGKFIGQIINRSELSSQLEKYIQRINSVEGIKDIDLHVEEVIGEDKTVDVVVEIFNQVNSGGTKLSKGDLALAKICAEWPEAREKMKEVLASWKNAGFDFNLDWLLRNVTAITTGEAFFSALRKVNPDNFKHGLSEAQKIGNYLLNMISGRLGLDYDRVLGGRYAFPVMCRYLLLKGGKISRAKERDRLLFWYVHSFLWGRFAGSTETVLNQDLSVLEPVENALDRLIEQLRLSRGSLEVRPEDYAGWSLGARFYPMLYLLTRVLGSLDWDSGVPLSAHLLGQQNALHVHHIFPKKLLYDSGYQRQEVNAIANYCFLTQSSNLSISAKDPAVYLPEIEKNYPGALASQWVPQDPELWKAENYIVFLARRRSLLAEATNKFLEGLYTGAEVTDTFIDDYTFDSPLAVTGPKIEELDDEIKNLLCLLSLHEIPQPVLNYEVCNTAGEVLTVVDLAWPDGIQKGFSRPLALTMSSDQNQINTLSQAGYLSFTSVDKLLVYLNEIQGMSDTRISIA